MSKRRSKRKSKYAVTSVQIAERESAKQKRIEALAKASGLSVSEFLKNEQIKQEDSESQLLRMSQRRSSKKVELTLISKRGTRIKKKVLCDECLKIRNHVWHYDKSSHGPVNLCAMCKEIVRSRTKKSSFDALNLANTGGLFEGNRRKH